MESIRDAAALALLILVGLSVRITPAPTVIPEIHAATEVAESSTEPAPERVPEPRVEPAVRIQLEDKAPRPCATLRVVVPGDPQADADHRDAVDTTKRCIKSVRRIKA